MRVFHLIRCCCCCSLVYCFIAAIRLSHVRLLLPLLLRWRAKLAGPSLNCSWECMCVMGMDTVTARARRWRGFWRCVSCIQSVQVCVVWIWIWTVMLPANLHFTTVSVYCSVCYRFILTNYYKSPSFRKIGLKLAWARRRCCSVMPAINLSRLPAYVYIFSKFL